MAELRPRQIAWQIIAAHPDPRDRDREAAGYPGLVRDHVRIWNENENMMIDRLRRLARRLARLERSAPTARARREAARDLDALRYQCQGWILDRMRERR